VALRSAWDLLWEPGDVWVRQRIGAAFILMLGGKAATIQVPFLFKYAIDGLSEPAAAAAVAGGADPATGGLLAAATLAPPALMLAYGGMRIAADGMTQLRNALFSYVTEDAIRRVSLRTFNHLMALDLAFHLDRQTGALTRIVERGTRAVGTVLSMSVLHVIPTAIEVRVVSSSPPSTQPPPPPGVSPLPEDAAPPVLLHAWTLLSMSVLQVLPTAIEVSLASPPLTPPPSPGSSLSPPPSSSYAWTVLFMSVLQVIPTAIDPPRR
jgi:ABC-type multidrug transport system fused ATPase/permease subunit